MKSVYGVMLKFWPKRCHFPCSIINLPIHSADVITAYQQLMWPVLGARRHPWVWLQFHRSLAGEFRQVCIPDRMAKIMTDIPVWDTLGIYFSAMSDLASQVSSRAWTCSPAISSYIQNGDSTAISGLLKPGLIQRNICVMAYPFAACADWLVGCSRHPISSLLAQWLGFRFTVLCASVCVVHNTVPHVSLHGFQNRHKPICRLLVSLCRTHLYGFFVHHLVGFFLFSFLFQGYLCCCFESINLYCSQQVDIKGSKSESLQEADYFTLFAHRPCCGVGELGFR